MIKIDLSQVSHNPDTEAPVEQKSLHLGRVQVSPTDAFMFEWTHAPDAPINRWEITCLYHARLDGRGVTTMTNCNPMIHMFMTSGWHHIMRVMITDVIENIWKDAHGVKHE